jgi:hypothetical protein
MTPIAIRNTIKKVNADTTVNYFEYSGMRFKYTSILTRKEGDDPCDSLFSYYFTVNDRVITPKSIPDSLRNHGFKFDKLCGFSLDLDRSSKFDLNGTTYLIIPSSTSECIGAFCTNEIDHIFQIKGNRATYLAVDGWNICDVSNDNQIDQVVFNDDPIQQYSFLNKVKTEKPNDTLNISVTKCANIQIWTFKNNEWVPLLDKNNNPYFIFLKFNSISDRDSYEVIDFNWINKF